jgi:CRISPR-associated exonuclease Cas4
MLPIVIILILIALVFFWQASRMQKASGLPGGRIIYADTRQWSPVKEPLYDAALGLTGRPDYLVERDGQVIPVEVKSSRIGDAPYDAHIYQLAAYCRLVQAVFDKRPAYGILHYPNRTFAIDYTPDLEEALLDLIDQIREADRRKEVDRSHENGARCRGCGFRSTCDQKIKK